MKNKNSLLSLGLISIPLIPLSAACTNGRKVDNLDTSKEEKVPQEVLNAIKTKKEELLPLETEANSLLELNDGSNYELNKSKSKVKEQIKKITSFLAKTKTLEELSNLDQLKNDLQTYIQELKATKVTQIQGDINRLKSLKKEVEQYINTELIDEEYDEIKKSLKEHLLETNNLINEDVYKVTKPQVVANYIALNKELAKAKLAKKEIVDNANYMINKLKANLNSKIIQYREFADEKFNDEIRIEFLSTLNKAIDVKNNNMATEEEIKKVSKELDFSFRNSLLNSSSELLKVEIVRANELLTKLGRYNESMFLFNDIMAKLSDALINSRQVSNADPISKEDCLSEYSVLNNLITEIEKEAAQLVRNALKNELDESKRFLKGEVISFDSVIKKNANKTWLFDAMDKVEQSLILTNLYWENLTLTRINFYNSFYNVFVKPFALIKLEEIYKTAKDFSKGNIRSQSGKLIENTKAFYLKKIIDSVPAYELQRKTGYYLQIKKWFDDLTQGLIDAGYYNWQIIISASNTCTFYLLVLVFLNYFNK